MAKVKAEVLLCECGHSRFIHKEHETYGDDPCGECKWQGWYGSCEKEDCRCRRFKPDETKK